MAILENEILLKNNQAVYADLLTFSSITFKGAKIEYLITRGDLVETGNIYLSFNRMTNMAHITTEANFDNSGVLFCATVNGGFVRLLYTSTDLGLQPWFKYSTLLFPM